MSWDVVLYASVEAEESAPLGPADEVRRKIAGVHPRVDWRDPAWGVLKGDRWSIEFNTGDGPTIETIMLHVRGEGDPISAILAICKATGWVAADMSTMEFLDDSPASRQSWDEFRGFRDQVINAVNAIGGTFLRRSHLRLDGATLMHFMPDGSAESHDLHEVSGLEFKRTFAWASFVLAAIAAGIAYAAKTFIPIGWLAWTAVVIFGALTLLFLVSSRAESISFTSGGRKVVYPLLDPPDEVSAFRSKVRDSVP